MPLTRAIFGSLKGANKNRWMEGGKPHRFSAEVYQPTAISGSITSSKDSRIHDNGYLNPYYKVDDIGYL